MTNAEKASGLVMTRLKETSGKSDGDDHFAPDRWEWPQGAVRTRIIDALTTQVRALARVQDAGGLWHTILDDPSSYLETSGSASIAYGLMKGARLGLLPQEFGDIGRRSAVGIQKCIDQRGLVTGVSYGTAVGQDSQQCRDIPLRATAYGQGLVFLMLGELR